MKYKVFFTEDAESDLFEIYEYIRENGYPLQAEKLLSELVAICEKLSHMPERGHIPKELQRVGMRDYLQIHLNIYRIIYQLIGSKIYIHCILDGRRDVQELLTRRILR